MERVAGSLARQEEQAEGAGGEEVDQLVGPGGQRLALADMETALVEEVALRDGLRAEHKEGLRCEREVDQDEVEVGRLDP